MRVRKGTLGGTWDEHATSDAYAFAGVWVRGRVVPNWDVEGDVGDEEEDGVGAGFGGWLTPRKASSAWMSELCAALGPESSVGRGSSGWASRPSKIHRREPESAPLSQGRISW